MSTPSRSFRLDDVVRGLLCSCIEGGFWGKGFYLLASYRIVRGEPSRFRRPNRDAAADSSERFLGTPFLATHHEVC